MKNRKRRYEIGNWVSTPALAGNKADKGLLTNHHIAERRIGEIIYIHPSGRFVTVRHHGLSGDYRESYPSDQINKVPKKRGRKKRKLQ